MGYEAFEPSDEPEEWRAGPEGQVHRVEAGHLAFDRGDERRHHAVDEREVTGLATVTVHPERSPGQRGTTAA